MSLQFETAFNAVFVDQSGKKLGETQVTASPAANGQGEPPLLFDGRPYDIVQTVVDITAREIAIRVTPRDATLEGPLTTLYQAAFPA